MPYAVGTYRLCQGTYTPDLSWHLVDVWLGLLFCWLQLRSRRGVGSRGSGVVRLSYGFLRYNGIWSSGKVTGELSGKERRLEICLILSQQCSTTNGGLLSRILPHSKIAARHDKRNVMAA